MLEQILVLRHIILKNKNNKTNDSFFIPTILRGKINHHLQGSKKKYNLPPDLDNTSDCLGEVIARQ